MPPVFGPASPSPTRLKSWAGAGRTASVAVAHREHRQLRPGHALLDHDRAAGVAERGARQLGPHVGLGLASDSVTSTPLPAARPSVFTTYGPGERRRKSTAGVGVVERAVAGGGHAGLDEHLLHPRLRALEAGAVGAGAEHPLALRPAAGRPGRRPAAARARSRTGRRRSPRRGVGDRAGMPGLPGVTTTSAVRAEHRRRARARARRPPTDARPVMQSRVRLARTARGRGRPRRGGSARRPAPRGRRRSRWAACGQVVAARWPR